MDSIVVGFDGRPSFVALDWAADRAARGDARVEIVMIGGTILSDDSHIDASLLSAERRLRDQAPDAEVTSRRCVGRMPDSLFEQAREAELLVVGSRRGRRVRSALTAWLPSRIASRSPIPVVVVPDGWAPEAGSVVIGLDDDDSSLAALDFAATEADAIAATLTVVHAWQMPTPRIEGSVVLLASPIQVKSDHRSLLRAAVRRVCFAHPGLSVERILVQDSPSAALIDVARDASLLVLGTHHRGLLAGVVLGSVGQDVLWQCPIPVCVVPFGGTS